MMEMIEAACAFIAVLIGIVLFIALEDTAHFVFRVILN